MADYTTHAQQWLDAIFPGRVSSPAVKSLATMLEYIASQATHDKEIELQTKADLAAHKRSRDMLQKRFGENIARLIDD